jgi:hypothetical protein
MKMALSKLVLSKHGSYYPKVLSLSEVFLIVNCTVEDFGSLPFFLVFLTQRRRVAERRRSDIFVK